MKLDAPEQLLAHLVPDPTAVPPSLAAADVASALQELRRRGHSIATADPQASAAPTGHHTPAERLKLHCASEHFAPQRFARARRKRLGGPLQVWEECDSTNALATEAAADGAPHGALWVAERQRRGRGRQGRQWHCPPHCGLLFSVLLRPSPGVERLQLLPLVVALGICEGLRHASGCDVRIAWPNDLVVGARKLGGVLVEARLAEPAHVVVGCGLNVRVEAEALAPSDAARATSLHRQTATLPPREDLLAGVLEGLETRYAAWCDGEYRGLFEAWPRYDALRERSVRVQSSDGSHRGTACGIGPDGSLELRLEDGSRRRFTAAEVHLA